MKSFNEPEGDAIVDNTINNICNEYYFQYMFRTKGIPLSKNRNFSKLKTKNPNEWRNFEKLAEMCSENNIDYKKYISFALSELLAIHKFVRLSYLLNIKYVTMYNEQLEIEVSYDKINSYILTSFNKILLLCKKQNIASFTDFLKYLIREKKLGHYMKCGVISKYILVLIPNIKKIKKYFDNDSACELELYVINKYDKLLNEAKIALEKHNNLDYMDLVNKFKKEIILK